MQSSGRAAGDEFRTGCQGPEYNKSIGLKHFKPGFHFSKDYGWLFYRKQTTGVGKSGKTRLVWMPLE